MYYPSPVSSREMSDRVHVYTKRYRKYGDTYANRCLFESLKEIIIQFVYFEPQDRLDLPEEDASEFVLYVMDKIPAILLSYRDEANDFYAYLNAVLDNKVKTFYRNRRVSELKEKSAVAAQVLFEVRSFPNNNGTFTVSDNSAFGYGASICARRLRFLALSCNSVQRRLFVFLLSVAPFLAVDLIENLCHLFCIDFKQTSKLISFIETNSMDITNAFNHLVARRNIYYSRKYQLENEYNKNLFFEDIEKACDTRLQIEKTKNHLDNKNLQLEKFSAHVSYSLLSNLLSIPRSTVACSIFYSKNLIAWCNEENPSLENFMDTGIGRNLAEKISNGNWEKEKISITHTSILYPEKVFTLNFTLNEDTK